jgi:hypothetical protein
MSSREGGDDVKVLEAALILMHSEMLRHKKGRDSLLDQGNIGLIKTSIVKEPVL